MRERREISGGADGTLPRDDRQKALLDVIHAHEQALRALNPFAALFGGMDADGFFEPLFGMDDDDDYDDDDDDD